MIEVLVALVILAGVVTGFGQAVSFSASQVRHQRMLSRAVDILDSTSEDLLLRAPGDTDLEPGEHSQEFDAEGYPVLSGSGIFRVQWHVEPAPSREDILQMDISAWWNEGAREYHVGWTLYRP